jgi:hypothetical protein
MYKCGWNGCEKAYGTLNHLNAHVTMQSHGQKRTPEGKSEWVVLAKQARRLFSLEEGPCILVALHGPDYAPWSQ